MPVAAAEKVKPLLRGVSHEVAAGVALAGWAWLTVLAQSPRAQVAANVYGSSLVALFLVSALYHRRTWSPRTRSWMRRLDHAAIFVLIAGTYTPLCLLLAPPLGRSLLTVAWVGALLGVGLSIFWIQAPKPLVALAAVVLGWVIVPTIPSVYAAVGGLGLSFIGVGGLAYTLGAVAYATRRPDPWPRTFGYHEVFHALVVLAAALHFAMVAGVVRALPGASG
jgi:hemolysin III